MLRATLAVLIVLSPRVAAQDTPPFHGTRPATLELANVHVVRGDGAPATGPRSVFVRDGRIVREPIESPAVRIDGTGCYVLPGIVCTHAHLQEQVAEIAIPMEYQLDLWLASGVTTIRDVGSTFARSLRIRQRSTRGEIAAPRVFLYQQLGPADTPAEAVARVDAIKEGGADGIKLWSNQSYRPDVLEALLARAREVGLRTTAHIGVGESNALHYATYGVTSIEHWYGVPDAALDGVQDFPPDFSYDNEVDRFRYAGRLWREARPERLDQVLATLVDLGVAWSPTLAVYEASRDLVRAQNLPWFADHLHPALERFFRPNLASHGSYFIGWTTADEAAWRESYRIWMQALRRFEELGGTITTGEDAGYIYLLYGFGIVRELELHQEAGFHPLEVIRHATYNGARVLGQETEFGRVMPGLAADLIVVRGNPLRNLKCLYPTGCDDYVDGRSVPTGGVQYTIKDGFVYHGPTLMAEVRAIVARDRQR
ncbi:MAG: amidohydrolase family protein [Planctomycetes bacterium]|nr:amidohydrolase family protein [Planctomycetota bacterium]